MLYGVSFREHFFNKVLSQSIEQEEKFKETTILMQ